MTRQACGAQAYGAPGRGPALVAVAHGSRDPRARAAVAALLARVRALRPGLEVRLGHIELDTPLIGAALAGLEARQGPDGDAVLVPLLFGRGHHVKHDLPRALAAAPHLRGTVADPLGPHPLLAEALHARLTGAVRQWFPAATEVAGPDAVVLAAAGSRDPDSAWDTARTAALLSARLGGVPVLPGYVCAAAPTVPEALAELAARGARRIALASCFTAPGLFAEKARALAAAVSVPASVPLGAHDAMARLVLHRYDWARLREFGGPAPRTSPNSAGKVHLTVDVEGFHSPYGGRVFVPAGPTRLLDTRTGAGPLQNLQQVTLGDGIPADAKAVLLNVTETQAQGGGHLSVGAAPSTLNFAAGQTSANGALVDLTTPATITNYSKGVQAIADLQGWFG